MHGFVIENISQDLVLLKFSDGHSISLKPLGKYIWGGFKKDQQLLQRFVDNKQLDVWVFQLEEKIDWRKEGF